MHAPGHLEVSELSNLLAAFRVQVAAWARHIKHVQVLRIAAIMEGSRARPEQASVKVKFYIYLKCGC